MTFNFQLKQELVNINLKNRNSKVVQLYGMLLFCKSYRDNIIVIQTENKDIILKYKEMIKELIKIDIDYDSSKYRNKLIYTIKIDNKTNIEKIIIYFEKNVGGFEENLADFFRGVFIACGTISNPEKEYRLEFCIQNKEEIEKLKEMLIAKFRTVKITKRRRIEVIYFKDSNTIEDVVTFIGGFKTTLEVMNVKVYKDLRNRVNRLINCETANIEKMVNASTNQIKIINRVVENRGIEALPDDLKEVAMLRLKNPDITLTELGRLCKQPISKSGVSHRLKRLERMLKE